MLSSMKDLEAAIATGKEIRYTLGFKYRHPTTYERPVDADEARRLAHIYYFDVKECDNWIDFNCYTSNDMW